MKTYSLKIAVVAPLDPEDRDDDFPEEALWGFEITDMDTLKTMVERHHKTWEDAMAWGLKWAQDRGLDLTAAIFKLADKGAPSVYNCVYTDVTIGA